MRIVGHVIAISPARSLTALTVVALVGAALVACAPVAAQGAEVERALQDVVGEEGSVESVVREASINSPGECGLEVTLTTAEAATLERVAAGIVETTADTGCEVWRVGTPSGAALRAIDWRAVPEGAWSPISDLLTRTGDVEVVLRDRGSSVSLLSPAAELGAYAQAVRAALDGPALDDTLGAVAWEARRMHEPGTSPWIGVDIAADQTPPVALAVAIDALGPVEALVVSAADADALADATADADDGVHLLDIEVTVEQGVTRVDASLSVVDWNAERIAGAEQALLAESGAAEVADAIMDAFAPLDAEVSVTAAAALTWSSATE